MINMGTIYMMQLEQTIKCSCTQNRSGGNIGFIYKDKDRCYSQNGVPKAQWRLLIHSDNMYVIIYIFTTAYNHMLWPQSCVCKLCVIVSNLPQVAVAKLHA